MKSAAPFRLVLLTVVVAMLSAGCSKSKSPDAVASPQPTATAIKVTRTPAKQPSEADSYACTLLTPEEIAAVQGEPFKATKPSTGTAPGLNISQCYFELANTVNSIVLTVTRKGDGDGARDPKESWEEIFHEEHPKEKEEEEGKAEPTKVEGLGDEAFWTGTRVGGALYVLKGNAYIRISVGGAGDQAEKTKRSKALAENVLKRL